MNILLEDVISSGYYFKFVFNWWVLLSIIVFIAFVFYQIKYLKKQIILFL